MTFSESISPASHRKFFDFCVIFYFLSNLSPLNFEDEVDRARIAGLASKMHNQIATVISYWFEDILSPEQTEIASLRHQIWLNVLATSSAENESIGEMEENDQWAEILEHE